MLGFFFPLSDGWSLIDESGCTIFTTDKSLSAPSVLIKTVGTLSNESHLATFSTLTTEFLLGERAAPLPPRTACHGRSAQAWQALWFRDVKLRLIIALTGQSEETFCALLNPSYLFSVEAVDSKDVESVRTVQTRKRKRRGDMIGVQLRWSIGMKRINCTPCAS